MKIYLVLAGTVALIGLGLFLMEYGRPPLPPCSEQHLTGERLEHCIEQEAESARLAAVLRAMREENARIEACDHRGLFGLWGKNECPQRDDPRPPVPCSLVVHWDNPGDRDRCLARESIAK
jgi:hypothetical protein